MNILLTNDDGIDSPGVRTLALCLAPYARLWAAVPKVQQSGAGHGITVRGNLRVCREEMPGVEVAWSIAGLPADCVKLAMLSLLPEPVDLVISGINEGANLGTDTLYSGTIAAATEGAMYELPAVAVSQEVRGELGDFWPAARLCLKLVQDWQAGKVMIAPMSILSLNVPCLPEGEIKGIRPARLGIQRYSDAYHLLEEDGEASHFQLTGERLPNHDEDLAVDTVLLAKGYATVTPISVDRTDYRLLAALAGIWD